MSEKLEKYLLDAIGKEKSDLSDDNPYLDIAFDGDQKRLGWIESYSFSQIKEAIEDVLPLLEGKDNFIFIGMGGSINGIKPLIALFKAVNFFTLDSLDPKALSNILDKIDNLEKTLIISISKSGTTKETQLLTRTLREVFYEKSGDEEWQKYFLWISDLPAFGKLDSLGWSGVKKICIQFDRETDIGGRFSSPQTLIFILPLFLLLGSDFSKLKNTYESFASLQPELRKQACLLSAKYKDVDCAYFSPLTDKRLGQSLSSWVVQLFQESLGSKLDNLPVKTIPNLSNDNSFHPLALNVNIDDPAVSLMSQMYFFQVFIAYYSAAKSINFVTQNYVEKYKNQMRDLEGKTTDIESNGSVDIASLIETVKSKITSAQKFIEIVLYFHPDKGFIDEIRNEFSKNFSQRKIMVFIGSDWNHQSYQAAFAAKDTFYVLLTLSNCKFKPPIAKTDLIKKNLDAMKLIAKATYLTIEEKSVFLSVL